MGRVGANFFSLFGAFGWVNPWAGLGQVGSKFFTFWCVGLTHRLGWVGSRFFLLFGGLGCVISWVDPWVGLSWVEFFLTFWLGWVFRVGLLICR